ncbi:hypothetical protein AGMMS49982_18310 [Bacteroidia bacterium]|nr:hypothetical protein AGMMS49982_18310 [Bacteroidia bacterium]
MKKKSFFGVVTVLTSVVLGTVSCETFMLDHDSEMAAYVRPAAVLDANVGIRWTGSASVSNLEGSLRSAAYAPAASAAYAPAAPAAYAPAAPAAYAPVAPAAYAPVAPAGSDGWVDPGTVNPVIPDENFLIDYWVVWENFKVQMEPRPYVYNKGATDLEDYVHDGVKNVYDRWEYRSDEKWHISSGDEDKKLVLSFDRFWADTLNNAYGWAHQDGGSGVFRSDKDKIRWKSATAAKMRQTAYVALYKQVEKSYYDFKLFVDAYGLAGHDIAKTLLAEMETYIRSNLDAALPQSNIKVDHSVWDNLLIPDTLNASDIGGFRFGKFDPQTAMLTNVVMESQQQDPTIAPTGPTSAVAARGKLFEFFFGSIDVDGEYIPIGNGFPVFDFDIVAPSPAKSMGITWGDPQPSLTWHPRQAGMTRDALVDTITAAVDRWNAFVATINPRPYYHAAGSSEPANAPTAYNVFSRASTSDSWHLEYHNNSDTITIKRYWSQFPTAPSQLQGWAIAYTQRQEAFKALVAQIEQWMAAMEASPLWNYSKETSPGNYPLRTLHAQMAAFIAYPATLADAKADRSDFSYTAGNGLTTAADLPADKTGPLFEYFFGMLPMPPACSIEIYWGTDRLNIRNGQQLVWTVNDVTPKKVVAGVVNPAAGFDYQIWRIENDVLADFQETATLPNPTAARKTELKITPKPSALGSSRVIVRNANYKGDLGNDSAVFYISIMKPLDDMKLVAMANPRVLTVTVPADAGAPVPQWFVEDVEDKSIGLIQVLTTDPYDAATGTYTSNVEIRGTQVGTTRYGVKVKQGGADTLITAQLEVIRPRIHFFHLFMGDTIPLLRHPFTLERMAREATPLTLRGGISGLPDDSEFIYLKWKFDPDDGSSASTDGSVVFSNGKTSGNWQPQTELWEFDPPLKPGLATIVVTNCDANGVEPSPESGFLASATFYIRVAPALYPVFKCEIKWIQSTGTASLTKPKTGTAFPSNSKILYKWLEPTLTLSWTSDSTVVTNANFEDKITAAQNRLVYGNTGFAYDIAPLPTAPGGGPLTAGRPSTKTNVTITRYWPASGGLPPTDTTGWKSSLDARKAAYTALVEEILDWMDKMEDSPLWDDLGNNSSANKLRKLYETMEEYISYPSRPFTDAALLDRTKFSIDPTHQSEATVTNTPETSLLYELFFGWLGQGYPR